MPRYLLLFTDISDRGGIEVFSRYFLSSIASSAENAQITALLLKNTSPPNLGKFVASRVKLICCGSRFPYWSRIKLTFIFFSIILFEKPTFIICNHINLARLCIIPYKFLRVRYAFVAYGIDVWYIDSFLKRQALINAHRIASFSHFTSSKILQQSKHLQSKKIFHLPPTVDQLQFYPMNEKPISLVRKYNLEQNRLILTVARLAPSEVYKGYDVVIKALPKIIKEVPNVKYLLVGKGEDIPRTRKILTEVGVTEYVILAGFVPNRELLYYYNLADVFVMPSKKEGFGIVFLEALACGKPVIAGNKDGSRDALLDGELGILIDPDDIYQVADAIIRVLKREIPESLQAGNHLRNRVLEVYGLEKFKQRVKALIDSIVE